ncbi:MAG: hypothetical protein K6G20_04550 [Ruminococcus sp.]|nr:hypothetical protein [Ruminococcus sp.]
MRTVSQKEFEVSCTDQKPEAVLTLEPSSSVSLHAPTGTVEFHVVGTSFDNTYSVQLNTGRRTSTAKLSDAENLSKLKNGIYQISASYGGDAIYGSFQTETVSILVGEDAIYPVLFNQNGERTDTFCYGDSLTLKFYQYSNSSYGYTSETYLNLMTENYGISDLKLKDLPGNYTKTVSAGGKTYTYSYTLKKRPVEIGISDVATLYAGDVEGKLPKPVLLSELVEGDTLDQLVNITYMNAMQSKEIVIDNSTGPGNYYAKLRPCMTNQNKTAYYDLKLYSATFPINSKLYDLTFKSTPLNGNEAGAIHMTLPENKTLTNGTLKYESGTSVKLTAAPYSGYLLDHWVINSKEYTTDTVSFIMSPQGYNVEIFFKKDTRPVKQGSVIVDETFLNDGSIIYPNDYNSDKSYAVGKEFTFTAVDTDNSVFDYWNEVIGNKTYTIHEKEISVTVSETPVILYPVFKGAPCKITLSDGISAEYETINEQEELVTYSVTSGMTVPKGTMLTLKALNADTLDHYSWYVNGNKQAENKNSITWTVTGDTNIELSLFTVQMDGHSLTLNGPITLNFYVDINGYDNKALTAKMTSTHYDSKQQQDVITDLGTFEAQDGAPCKYNSGFDEYRFSVPLAAAMINDKITMEVYLEGNNQPILTNIYSVAEYANSKIAASSNKDLVNTMIALLDYGTQAQKYFDYNNIEGKYANETLTAEQIASARDGITAYTAIMEQTNAIDKSAVNSALAENNIALTYTGSSLLLDSGVKLRYYFKPTTSTVEDALTAYSNSMHFTNKRVNAVTGIDGNEIFIETEQLPAALLTDSNSYSLSFGDAVVIDNATISSYFKSIYVKGDSNAKRVQLKSVNEALYYFAENSKIYFNK